MIRVEFSRKDCKIYCDGCDVLVGEDVPTYSIILGDNFSEYYVDVINLCEDCGKHLQNSISDNRKG